LNYNEITQTLLLAETVLGILHYFAIETMLYDISVYLTDLGDFLHSLHAK